MPMFTPKEELKMLITYTAGRLYTLRKNTLHYSEFPKNNNIMREVYRELRKENQVKYDVLLETLKDLTETFRRSYPKRH